MSNQEKLWETNKLICGDNLERLEIKLITVKDLLEKKKPII